eukprot:TRINITY_DN13520_c0_g1_i1.p1 TRINITY_DN13520_c0_g1~~TRINITY_DN13520_c0_g1_i1.p1  ORF type:complete len:200 (-),score=39.64 TRINITY_DN13520_c0_g1_i1:1251-1850(-)
MCIRDRYMGLQLGIGIIELLFDPPEETSKDYVRVYYGCLAEYSLLFFASLTLCAYVTIISYHNCFEFSLILFWAYFALMHLTISILKGLTVSFTAAEIVEICLHLAIVVMCTALELLYTLTDHKPRESYHAARYQEVSCDLSQRLMVNEYQALRVYVKKCQIVENDVLCSVISVINGSTSKFKVTFKELQAFDLMVWLV